MHCCCDCPQEVQALVATLNDKLDQANHRANLAFAEAAELRSTVICRVLKQLDVAQAARAQPELELAISAKLAAEQSYREALQASTCSEDRVHALEQRVMQLERDGLARSRRLVARSVDLKLMLHSAIRDKENAELELEKNFGRVTRELECAQELVSELQRHNVQLECELEEIRMENQLNSFESLGLQEELAQHEAQYKMKVTSPEDRNQEVLSAVVTVSVGIGGQGSEQA